MKLISKEKVPLEGLNAELRSYQQKGFDWLEFLRKNKLGGILADDMGLGKTLQTLTLLLKEKERKVKQPSLVVMPTSLVYNWLAEARKFTPDLNIMADLSGDAPRNLVEGLKAYDLNPDKESAITDFATEIGRENLMLETKHWCLPFRDPVLPNFSVDIFLKHPANFEELWERNKL